MYYAKNQTENAEICPGNGADLRRKIEQDDKRRVDC